MSRPDILIPMVDQLAGTRFPDGPAGWLHVPDPRRLAECATRYADADTASPLCAPGRAGLGRDRAMGVRPVARGRGRRAWSGRHGIRRRGLGRGEDRPAGRAWTCTACPADPEQLFDLESDPQEVTDLAGDPARATLLARFRALAAERRDLACADVQVRESQARRRLVDAALRQGGCYPRGWQPIRRASERDMRNHMDLNVPEQSRRVPRGE